MRTTASLAWPGGKADRGDTIDPASIPPLTLARWQETRAIVPDDEWTEDAEPISDTPVTVTDPAEEDSE